MNNLKELGLDQKFIVLKVEDVEKLSQVDRVALRSILYSISRASGNKGNEYLVINTDEEYAEEVAAIIREHENIK